MKKVVQALSLATLLLSSSNTFAKDPACDGLYVGKTYVQPNQGFLGMFTFDWTITGIDKDDGLLTVKRVERMKGLTETHESTCSRWKELVKQEGLK